MDQLFSPIFPDPTTLKYMLLAGGAVVAGLLGAGLVASALFGLLMPFVPRMGKKQIVHDGVEQLERLGFATVER